MSWRSTFQRRGLARAGLISWLTTTLLAVSIAVDPYAATASPLQLHGALQRADTSPGTTEVAEAASRIGVVSHRGAAALAPENTLSAFRLAIEQGVDFVETDVQLTSDGVPVLMHDPTLDRTTSGSGPIAQHSFDEVRALDAGSWFSSEFAGEQVPTLEEFLDLLRPAPTRAFLELKGQWGFEQVEALMQLLRERQLVNRVVLESFEVPNLEMAQAIAPEFARMLLTRELSGAVLDVAIELRASAIGARKALFIDDPGFISDIRDAGMGAVVYTLNTEKQWELAVEMGIDFVITDDPVSLAEWRSERSSTEHLAA